MKDSQRLGILKDTLTVIFGLEDNTVDKVVRAIKNSPDSIDVKTPNIRTRIGPRALQYLRNAIEVARHEGTEKHGDKSADKSKDSDISPTSRKRTRKKSVKENTMTHTTFKEFLLETTVDVDLSDPQSAMMSVKQAHRLNKQSPDRLNRENMNKAKQDKQEAQKSAGADPTANLKSKIAQKRIELATLNKRLNAAEKSATNATGEV